MTQSQIRSRAKSLNAKINALKAEYEESLSTLKQKLRDTRKACAHPSIPKWTKKGTLNWGKDCNWGKTCEDCGYTVPTPNMHFQ